MRKPYPRDDLAARVIGAVRIDIATEVTHPVHSPACGVDPRLEPAASAGVKGHALPRPGAGQYHLQPRPVHWIDQDSNIRPRLAVCKINSKKVLSIPGPADSQHVVHAAHRER